MTLLALAVSGRGLVDPGEPVVFADDEGFLRGRGAFETLRVYGGTPFRLAEHLDRLEGSAERLGIRAVARAEVERLALGAVKAAGVPDAFLRIFLTPGREGAEQPVALALVGSLPPDLEEMRARGIGLISVPLGLDGAPLAGVKSTSYAVNMAAVDEARRRGADDAVFLGLGGVVLEGPTTNIWWRRDRTLCTPALELGLLAGVTRAALLEAAPALGYEIDEGAFTLDALAGAHEAFTSSSVREVMPVNALDGKPIPLGAAAAELQQALRRAAEGT